MLHAASTIKRLLFTAVVFMGTMAMMTVSLQSQDEVLSAEFVQWMTTHGKNYRSIEEFQERFAIYRVKDSQIEEAIASGIVGPSTIGHNKFSDRRPEERGSSRGVSQLSLQQPRTRSSSLNSVNSPLTVGYNEIQNYCNVTL